MSGDGRVAVQIAARSVRSMLMISLRISLVQLESVRKSADVILRCNFDRPNPAGNP
jgi:hypothetical protein